jgi:hypothetical protein
MHTEMFWNWEHLILKYSGIKNTLQHFPEEYSGIVSTF